MPDKQRALIDILKRLPANMLLYGSALGAIAAIGGANIPPELQLVATGLGINILSNMLERVARGEKIPDDEIRREVQRAIEESNIADALTEDRFYRAVSQLVRHMDLRNDELRSYMLDGFEALATSQQADQILTLQQRILELLETQGSHTVATPCNLVPRPPHFAGRRDDLANLRAQLTTEAHVAVVAVRGLGGIGKTTLVQGFANLPDNPFPLRLWAMLGQDFRQDIEPNILKTWARRLAGVEFPPEAGLPDIRRAVGQILTQCTCGTPALLVIDDVWEHTVPIARSLQALVHDLPELDARVLVTTRSEQVAADLDCRTSTLEKMTPPEGADLIIDLLPAAEPHRALLETVSDTLGGHPLALKLAARRLRINYSQTRLESFIQTCQQGIAAGDPFADLRLESAEERAKEHSVSVTLKMTLDALANDDLRPRFRALGALPADLSFRPAHVYALWESDDMDALDTFVAEGLLTPESAHEGYYSQHRLLRAYARALSRKVDELDAATIRHRVYLIEFAASVFDEPPEKWNDLSTQADFDQIHALGDDLASQLAGTADPDQQDARLKALADDPVGAGLAAPEYTPPDARTSLLFTTENFVSAVTNYIFRRYVDAEGRRWLWAGLAAARAHDSQYNIGLFANELALWHNQRGDMQESLAYYEQNLTLTEELELDKERATTLNNIGAVWSALGEKDKALDYYQQALPLYQAVSDRGGEARTLNNIGMVWSALGEKDKALDYYQQALPLFQAVGDRDGEAGTLNNIGGVYRRSGDNDTALDYFRQALLLFHAVSNFYSESSTHSNIASILWEQGQRAAALEHMQTARDFKARIGISTEAEDRMLARWRGEIGHDAGDENTE